MESIGDEKRIQALFSELSREDSQTAPRFEQLWREAVVAETSPRFSRSLLAVAVTLVFVVTVFLVVRYRNESFSEHHVQTVPPQMIPGVVAPKTPEPERVSVAERRTTFSHSSRRRILARRQRSERVLEQQAALLANWKSPTEFFVTAPTSSGFSSLPQLSQAANDLQSFLERKDLNQ